MGMPGADAVVSCPQIGNVCLNYSDTKSWQAWNDLIEKKAATSDSSLGVTAAAVMHLPADKDCPVLMCSSSELSRSSGFQHSSSAGGQLLYRYFLCPHTLQRKQNAFGLRARGIVLNSAVSSHGFRA